MMAGDPWQDLRAELDRWTDAERRADFWLRDDDAVAPTPALDRLLALTQKHGVPLLLAVIPKRAGERLAERLDGTDHVSVGLHGWAHANHAASSEKKQEFGPHRSHGTMLMELAEGRRRLERLHGRRFISVLVPPWNRIDPNLAPHLPDIGLTMLSTFGAPEPTAQIRLLNSTVDIIDWHGGRGARDPAELVEEIVLQLRHAFEDGQRAIGLLTHHLVHDEAAWLFLERLFEVTAKHRGCCWKSFADLAKRASDATE